MGRKRLAQTATANVPASGGWTWPGFLLTAALLWWSLGEAPWKEAVQGLAAPLRAVLGPGAMAALAGFLQSALATMLLVVAVWLPGDRILAAWLGNYRGAERAAFSFGTGLILHSAGFTLMAAVDGFTARYVAGWVIGSAGLAALDFLRPRERLPAEPSAPLPEPAAPDLWDRLGWAVLAGLLAGPALLAAAAPTTFYDALVYHFAVPEEFLRAGGFIPLPHNLYSAFPMGWDILNAVGPAFGSPDLPKALTWGCLAALVCLFGSAPGAGTVGWLAGALLCSSPAVLHNVYAGGVEVPMALFLALAFRLLIPPGEDPSDDRRLVLGCLFAGMTLGIKSLALLPWGAGLIVLAWRWRRPGPVLGYLAAGALFAAPWLVKNQVYYSNPVYPFLEGELTRRVAVFSQAISPSEWSSLGTWTNLLYPLAPYARSTADMEFVGPALLWLPALLWAGRSAGGVGALLIILGLSWCGWAGSTRIIRYLLPVLPLGLEALSRCLRHPEAGPLVRQLRPAALGLILACGLLGSHFVLRMQGWKAVLGLETSQENLSREILTWFNPYTPIIPDLARLGSRDKVLLVGEARSYYLPCRVVATSALQPQAVAVWAEEARAGQELRSRLEREGITHIVLNLPEAIRLDDMGKVFTWGGRARAVFAEFWRDHVDLIAERVDFQPQTQYAVFLYGLRSSPRPKIQAAPENPILRVMEMRRGKS